jgi:uncharacterized protein with von Willebrand factor type A (vWA) domain
MAETSGFFIHNLILFGRLLRCLGLDVNPGRMIDLIQALGCIDIRRKADFYYSTRSLLVHRLEDIPLFDEAFNAFWRIPGDEWTTLDLGATGELRRPRRPLITPPPLQPPKENPAGRHPEKSAASNEQQALQVTMTYSDREVLRHKNFTELTGEELEAIKRLISELVWQIDMRRSRRLQPGAGRKLDLRRTLRRNLKYGGEVLIWARRQQKLKHRPLVIIADISGSMERYSRLLLHFIYSMSAGLQQRVEAFVFSTRLTQITHQLRGRDVDQALKEVTHRVHDWSGGTRIGEALKTFNFEWGRRVLGQGAVVLLISDGWDRGDAELLHAEIARLQRSCHRLIWLNPLLGSDQYEPLTRGMRTALPFIDDFLPVHNLASLEDLARRLGQIDQNRPLRRQTKGYPS